MSHFIHFHEALMITFPITITLVHQLLPRAYIVCCRMHYLGNLPKQAVLSNG